MKETFYFQHDYNARNDPKIQDVLIEHGVAGIGIFWCIIEQIYEQGGKLPLKTCKSIAFALHADYKTVESIVNNFDLFCNDGTYFWSNSATLRLNKRKEISRKRKNAIEKRWIRRKTQHNQIEVDTRVTQDEYNSNTNVLQDEYNSNTNVIQNDTKERKGKERKEKENKEYNIISSSLNSEDISENKFSATDNNTTAKKEKCCLE